MNIRQVARLAGVSTATVSRVINGTGPVKPETYEKVMRVVQQEGFHPNLLGQKLRNAQTGMLLVLVSSIANPFCALTVRGIEHEAERRGYHILLCNSESNPEREKAYLELLRGKVVDGVITMDATTRTAALKEQIGDRPWVQCGEFEPGVAPYVSIDNHAAALAVVAHLVASGRTRIGLIGAKGEYMYARERERGYRDGLAAAGLSFSKVEHADSVTDFAEGSKAYAAMHARGESCDAVFAISDVLACGALSAATRAGRHVPGDLAIVGFDDLPYAEITSPMLTTVRQPMFDLGSNCARLLVDQIVGEERHDGGVILPWELIRRGSA